MQFISAIAPVLIMTILGGTLRRFELLSREGLTSLNSLVFTVLIPALLFNGVLRADLSGLNFSGFLLAYFTPLLVLLMLGFCLMHYVGFNRTKRGVLSVTSVFGNLTVIGIPVCFFFFGEQALLPMSVIISCHSFILFSAATLMIESEGVDPQRIILQLRTLALSFFKNPITMSLFAALFLNLVGFELPKVVAISFELLSQAATPLAFIVLGATLSQFGLKGDLGLSILLSSLKLIVLPLCVWFSMNKLWHIGGLWLEVGVVVSALPIGVITQSLARRYQCAEKVVASMIIVSTIMSLFTIPVIVYLIS